MSRLSRRDAVVVFLAATPKSGGIRISEKWHPSAFFVYGGLVAIQTLWAAPWMIKVAGYSPGQAASGLFWISVSMLVPFWVWGVLNPWLARRGLSADRLIVQWGMGLVIDGLTALGWRRLWLFSAQ